MRKTGLIAFDLDGTILDSRKQISQYCIAVLEQCIRQGIWVVPATGRTVDGLSSQLLNISGIKYAITTNGAVVADLESGAALKNCFLPKETALEILRRLEQYHVMYDPYIKARGISQARFMNHLGEYGVKGEIERLVRSTRDVVENIIQFVEATDDGVEKINVFLADVSDREKIRRALSDIPGIVISSSLENNMEINARGATKGEALGWLADYLGVAQEETMAFGDGENDVTMLKAAGTGIAMANGVKAVLEAADETTLTNDEDGVAKAIERLVLRGNRQPCEDLDEKMHG